MLGRFEDVFEAVEVHPQHLATCFTEIPVRGRIFLMLLQVMLSKVYRYPCFPVSTSGPRIEAISHQILNCNLIIREFIFEPP